MKRFQFPLDRVRLWRAGQAALEEAKLERMREQLTRLREEKRRMESDRAHSGQEVLGQASIQGTDLQNLDAYRLHLRGKVQDIEERERQAADLMGQQRLRVVQARRNAELLERLKQKAREEWQVASDREQEGLAAELYLARRVRR